MVDPNRKINRLSDDDAAFLVECEQEFRNRYTDGDEEFAAFAAKPAKAPPIVESWSNNRRQHNDSGNNWNRNNYRQNNYNRNNDRNNDRNHHYNRNNDNRSQRNYRQHYNRPYDRNFRREGENSGHGSSRPY